MLTRLLFAVTLALVIASPALADANHGGSGMVGPTRVGELNVGASTEADVRAFAGNPDVVFDELVTETGMVVLSYRCRERDGCWTEYKIDRVADAFVGFNTGSKQFRTRRGTRVGDRRKRAERRERRKADVDLCGDRERAIRRVHDDRRLCIFIKRRRVAALVVEGPARPSTG